MAGIVSALFSAHRRVLRVVYPAGLIGLCVYYQPQDGHAEIIGRELRSVPLQNGKNQSGEAFAFL
jgi:hypothetical protein